MALNKRRMHIVGQSNSSAGYMGKAPSARPDWFVEWLKDQGKWVELECGCIEDIQLPNCLSILTGKQIVIECPNSRGHGFRRIKKTIKFREVLERRGIITSSQCDNEDSKGLFPPF